VEIPGIDGGATTTRADVERVANKFLFAVQEAGAIYRHIEKAKGKGKFIPEVSMDETDAAADAD
jgi:N-acetylglucosamine kinase-like BadF-type ATPase